jgi:RND family efflux transporter MFP subunit
LVGALIFVLLLYFFFGQFAGTNSVRVNIYKVVPRELSCVFEAEGEITPLSDMEISSTLLAMIEEVKVDEGDRVVPGEILVKLDNSDLHALLNQAKAKLSAAKTDLESMKTAVLNKAKAALSMRQSERTLLRKGSRPEDLRIAEINLNKAKLALEEARKKLDRGNKLLKSGIIDLQKFESLELSHRMAIEELRNAEANLELTQKGSRIEEIEVAEEAVRAAEANLAKIRADINVKEQILEQAKAEVALYREKIRKSVLHAPIPAVIAKRYVEPGEIAMPGKPLLKLVDLTNAFADIKVKERYVGAIAIGSEVPLSVESYPGTAFKARVINISPISNESWKIHLLKEEEEEKTFTVKMLIASPSVQLRAGMSVWASFRVTLKSTLCVPKESVFFEEGSRWIWISEGGVARRKKVEIGIQKGKEVEILRGIRAGELVITGGIDKLRDGCRVRDTR